MKKVMIVLLYFISSMVMASQYHVKIINNSKKSDMTVRYKICKSNCEDSLIQDLHIGSKSHGPHYNSIALEDVYDYVKIMDVVSRDESGKVTAQGDFRLHNCYGYYDRTVILDAYDSPYVTCIVESFR